VHARPSVRPTADCACWFRTAKPSLRGAGAEQFIGPARRAARPLGSHRGMRRHSSDRTRMDGCETLTTNHELSRCCACHTKCKISSGLSPVCPAVGCGSPLSPVRIFCSTHGWASTPQHCPCVESPAELLSPASMREVYSLSQRQQAEVLWTDPMYRKQQRQSSRGQTAEHQQI
jgi:hypothetical protein